MDLVALRRLHSLLRRVLRRGTRVNPLDDHRGALLAGAAAGRHVGGGPHQLVCKLPRGDWLPNYAGWHLRWFSIKFLHVILSDNVGELHISTLQCVPCHILGVYLQESSRD